MAIDKESTGLPELDLARATTKVNLAVVFGAAVFFIAMFFVVLHFAQESGPDSNRPSPSLNGASGQQPAPAPAGGAISGGK